MRSEPPATGLSAILACDVHIPRLRIARSVIGEAMAWANPPARKALRGARAIGNWDEDALTMAVEAARACLGATGTASAALAPDAVFFSSTTAPFADRDAAVLLAGALDLPESCDTLNLGGSLRAGTSGLMTAARRSRTETTLLVASDARLTRPGSPQELTYGDAAAAVLLGPPSADTLATVVATRRFGTDFVDRYRMSGNDFDYALEERWVRDESLMKRIPEMVSALLAEAGCRAGAVRHLILPTSAATAQRLAQSCGLSDAARDERVLSECGDSGAALPLVMLAASLERAQPGELILLFGVGQGIDALLLRAEQGVQCRAKGLARSLARKSDETSYVRYLSHRRLLDVDFGMRAERDQRTAHTVAYRKRAAITGFQGGRCEECGTIQFPQSRVCVNPECRETDTQQPYRLADTSGRVKSFTEDWQAYAARPPYMYGNVEFNEGGNLLMEFTDVEAGELKVNDQVRFVFRIKDEDQVRGFRRYFWKATKA